MSTSILILRDCSVWKDMLYTSVLSFKNADSTFPKFFLSFFVMLTSRPRLRHSSIMAGKYFSRLNSGLSSEERNPYPLKIFSARGMS